ncbi:hypothetical protein [Halosegnis longus]|uniref:hypothetical protein n=1 Tax=Halosegnis longus TaxID=2216012 RepID=UPI00129D82B1|nr:hypothetical protein [Halosegnis longus]
MSTQEIEFSQFEQASDTVVDSDDSAYFCDFGGFAPGEGISNSVTHDTIVHSDGSVDVQVNGTNVNWLVAGGMP